MESKKQRFAKGSEEAKAYMAGLRAKRGNKGGGGANNPPACSECPPCTTTTEKPKTKRNNKNIVVDF